MFTPCLVFALAISTVTPDKASKEQLREDVSSAVVSAGAAQAAQGSRPALVQQLRSAVRGAVARVIPQLIQLAALSSGSRHIAQQLADQIAQQLADQIVQQLADQVVEDQDLALRGVLDAEDEVAPRFIGAFTLGVAEILTDAINTVMRERKVNRKHAEKQNIKQN